VWEWHPRAGWKIVPGSESAGPNGLEISKDGKTLFIGAWGSQSVVRLSLGQTPPKKDSVGVGFRVDNVRWAPDGMLIAAGQGGTGPSGASHVAKVDPSSLKVQPLVQHPYDQTFTAGTVAIQVGKEIWVGSVRGDRIAIFPAQP
jgi:sugar lactone lactonase YvrE